MAQRPGKGFMARQTARAINETGGYRNEHHLISEKVTPDAVQALAVALTQPQNLDIANAAKQGRTFENCLAIIAARLDIVLDGVYDAVDLCSLLVKALNARGHGGDHSSSIDSRLVRAEIVEREDSLELIEEAFTPPALSAADQQRKQRTLFMIEHGCRQCDQIALCVANAKCLGDVPVEDAIRRLEDLN